MRFITVLAIGLVTIGCAAKKEVFYQPVKVADGLKFPEGPAWDGRGNVYVSNCDIDAITRVNDATGKAQIAYRGTPNGIKLTNGLTFDRAGSLFACDHGRGAVVEIRPDGTASVFVDKFEGTPLKRPNDLAFDSKGNLYFTDPGGSGKDNPIGTVYRVDRERKIRQVASGLAFPNGIAFSADARTLYVAESQKFQVLKYTVRPDGGLSEKAVFCTLPGEKDPDGMNFDSAGNLWVAQAGGGAVHVFDPSGKLIRSVQMPGKTVTNVEFAGKDLRTLYVTEVETGAIYKMRVETPGLKLFYSPE